MLPIPLELVAPALRRMCDPQAPTAARTMAARGVVPAKGAELLLVLAQLAHDPEPSIRQIAHKTLSEMPEGVLGSALEDDVHPAVLHYLALELPPIDARIIQIATHPAVADATVVRLAAGASELVSERIASNEARLLRAPAIVEALYKNPATRMSTTDRMIELCARNGIRVPGIPGFDAIAESLGTQLIPEPSAEPLPTDSAFSNVLVAEDEDAYDDEDNLKKKYNSAAAEIGDMTLSEKIRAATVGTAMHRAILVRDSNRMVYMAVVDSPRLGDAEAVRIALSKQISDDVLRGLANRRDVMRLYEMKKALAFNPKTPLSITLAVLNHLRENDLKALARSRGVPAAVVSTARSLMQRREKK